MQEVRLLRSSVRDIQLTRLDPLDQVSDSRGGLLHEVRRDVVEEAGRKKGGVLIHPKVGPSRFFAVEKLSAGAGQSFLKEV